MTASAAMPAARWHLSELPKRASDVALGRRGRWRQVLLWSIIALIAARLLAPLILTRMANAALGEGDQVHGSITGVSLGLLTCSYAVHGLELRTHGDDGVWRPLLEVGELACDLEWLPLLRGELVGDAKLRDPVLHVFAKTAREAVEKVPGPDDPPTRQEPVAPPWQASLRTVVRARLTAVTISNGEVHYRDEQRAINADLTAIAGRIEELSIPQQAITHRSPFHLTATTPGGGQLQVDGEADLLASGPTFLAQAKLEQVDLVALNPLTAQVGNLTFASGTFSGYAEVVADGRRLGGYLKVLFHHLDIRSFGEAAADVGTSAFWTVVIAVAENILENTERHQHAARIPLMGPLKDPDTDVWTAIGTAVANAFIRALAPGFERPSTG